MYRCNECGRKFEEPIYETICFEDLYGVGSQFEDRHYGTIITCPFCHEHIDPEMDLWDEEYDDEDDE